MGWNSQRRARCALCNRTLGYFNTKATCGVCFRLWCAAGGLDVKDQVEAEERRSWDDWLRKDGAEPRIADDAVPAEVLTNGGAEEPTTNVAS